LRRSGSVSSLPSLLITEKLLKNLHHCKKTSTVIHQPHSLPLISPARRVHFTHPFPTPSILYGARISGNVAFYADALWTGHGGRLRDKHN